jgi:hypothetical protein
MTCRYGHDHTKHPVVAATHNPSFPRGPRPYHCPLCPESHKLNRKDKNWLVYLDIEAAQAAGHPNACGMCFTPAPREEEATP